MSREEKEKPSNDRMPHRQCVSSPNVIAMWKMWENHIVKQCRRLGELKSERKNPCLLSPSGLARFLFTVTIDILYPIVRTKE